MNQPPDNQESRNEQLNQPATEPEIKVEAHGSVTLLTLNRPKTFNPLSDALINQLADILLSNPHHARCFVLTGHDKVFAAGGDIAEMAKLDYATVLETAFVSAAWDRLETRTIPLIAAVNGLALGGGCELALHCDMIIAGQSALFAQPEIKLGIIPGAGGTQRLTRAIGKAKAMEMVLTGRQMGALEAERLGMVTRVTDDTQTVTQALQLAAQVASFSKPVINLARQAVNHAFASGLHAGMQTERQLLLSTFALADQQEGMSAFLEKRPPQWRDR